MKKLLVIFAMCFIMACQSQTPSFMNMNPIEFKSFLESQDAILLDVRTPQEQQTGIIEEASKIDFYDPNFEYKIAKIQKDKKVFVYCKSGGRSEKAAQLLIASGHKKVINLNGGIMAWKKAGFSLTASEDVKDENLSELSIVEFNSLLHQHELVLVDFHTLWCVPCRKIAPMIDQVALEFSEKIHISRIDIDQSQELAESYSIHAVPTLVLFKSQQEVWRHTGVISKDSLLKDLELYW
jgi:thioredoxin 1